MVGSARYRVCDVQQKQPEAEQRGDSYVHLLRRRAEEDREENGGGEDAGQDDVHDVERVFALDVNGELDEGEALVGTAGEEELVAVHLRVQHLPLAVLLVRVLVYLLLADNEHCYREGFATWW